MDGDCSRRGNQRVHGDDRRAGIDHFLDRIGERADAEGLDGDEIPLLGGHVVDGGALLGGCELAVEPGDLDIHQLGPGFSSLLALGAPGGLKAGVREGRLHRFAGWRQGLRHGGIKSRIGQKCAGKGRTTDGLEYIAAVSCFLDKVVKHMKISHVNFC